MVYDLRLKRRRLNLHSDQLIRFIYIRGFMSVITIVAVQFVYSHMIVSTE